VLYSPNDPETLAATIAELLANPDKMHTLAERGRKSVDSRYSSERMVSGLLEVYRELI
jgi:glycosyltransferase involved in cell wall biosynthesis